jgi:CheY-like chemotaxis protein
VTRIALKSGKLTILVVDDNIDAVEALAQILEYEGYAVATAYDGRAALEYLGGHPTPDLTILDLMMPIMNGWELRAELAKVPALAKVPIVAMTGARARSPDRGRRRRGETYRFEASPADHGPSAGRPRGHQWVDVENMIS